MGSRRRSQSSFWQHPAVIAVSCALAAALVVGSYFAVRPEPASAAVIASNAAARSQASAAASAIDSSMAVARQGRTAVFIGDSYTAAVGATPGKGFTADLAAAEHWTERNLGRGSTGYFTAVQAAGDAKIVCGLTYCPRYSEMIAQAAAAHPGIVVVSGGRNDTAVPAATEAKTIRDFYAALRKALPDARILATSPLWDDRVPPATLTAIAADVRASVLAVQGTYLDLGQPLADNPQLIAPDGIHPNTAGHALIAAAIQRLLPAASS